jgi:hypothetical protein
MLVNYTLQKATATTTTSEENSFSFIGDEQVMKKNETGFLFYL